MDTGGDEVTKADISFTKALRKYQEKCQMLVLERDDLQRRLSKIEGESFNLSSSARKAETQSLQYAEERQRLLDEVVQQRKEIKSCQEKLAMYRNDSQDSKKNASLSRDTFESIINQQRMQIEKLQNYADAASTEAGDYASNVNTLTKACQLFLTERSNLMHMLTDTLHTMQNLFYDPSNIMKASQATPASVKPTVIVPGTDQHKKEMAGLREVASQLEKEISEAFATYKQQLHKLKTETDRAQRIASATVNDPSQVLAVCSEVLTNGTDSWFKDKEVFRQAVQVMEYKLNQLLKIRSVFSLRADSLKKSSKPIWEIK